MLKDGEMAEWGVQYGNAVPSQIARGWLGASYLPCEYHRTPLPNDQTEGLWVKA